jgi:hypothetical protein
MFGGTPANYFDIKEPSAKYGKGKRQKQAADDR